MRLVAILPAVSHEKRKNRYRTTVLAKRLSKKRSVLCTVRPKRQGWCSTRETFLGVSSSVSLLPHSSAIQKYRDSYFSFYANFPPHPFSLEFEVANNFQKS